LRIHKSRPHHGGRLGVNERYVWAVSAKIYALTLAIDPNFRFTSNWNPVTIISVNEGSKKELEYLQGAEGDTNSMPLFDQDRELLVRFLLSSRTYECVLLLSSCLGS
jgi:hypothetical protein